MGAAQPPLKSTGRETRLTTERTGRTRGNSVRLPPGIGGDRIPHDSVAFAVWIGFIALVGIATDDGVVMATYLKQRFEQSPPSTLGDVHQRTLEAAERRIRPCLMTTATTILALLPVITSQGRGADIMVPMALPSVGGMAVELITLFIVPVLFCAAEEWRMKLAGRRSTNNKLTPSSAT